jgi:hypothetical protein
MLSTPIAAEGLASAPHNRIQHFDRALNPWPRTGKVEDRVWLFEAPADNQIVIDR